MAKDSLRYTLSKFLGAIAQDEAMDIYDPFLNSIIGIYQKISTGDTLPHSVHDFPLDDTTTNNIIRLLRKTLQEQGAIKMERLNSPISYLLDELICNIQQHAHTENGYAFIRFNKATNYIELIVADSGITIYGSYASAQKYLELIGNSDASALNLAQSGYSTKNLPNAENRGYGISSNIKMVVEGLNGEFAVLSGNALLLQSSGNKKILALPPEIDFKGTMVIVRFPAMIPNDFNLYSYTN